jgi:single-strand DNA-binding protein
MAGIQVTITGNLTGDPELKYTPNGVPVATFTVASNERFRGNDGQWQDGPTSFVRCNAWRELAEHVAESMAKGDRAVVTGNLRQRTYEVDAKGPNDSGKRTVWEVAVTEIGASLRYATVKISKVRRDGVPVPEDPWAGTNGGPRDEDAPTGEPPF